MTTPIIADENHKSEKSIPKNWMGLPFRRWCELYGVSYSHGYDEVKKGKLKITKSGCRSLILRHDSDAYFGVTTEAA